MPTPLCQHCRFRPPSRPGRPYCSKACSNAARAVPLAARFAASFTIGAPDACWPWTGSRDRDGYGVITSDERRQLRAPRLAYERAHGTIPAGRQVMHSCDNPPCVNPSHLSLGGHDENVADKVAKGRQARGETIRGQLTADTVRAIRQALRLGTTYAALAKEHGVGVGAIGAVARNETWKHVD